MDDDLRSILVKISVLCVVACVALVITLLRRPRGVERRTLRRVAVVGAITIAVQAGHFVEELATGFYEAFPAVLGVTPWTRTAFVMFNVTWLAIWVISLPGVMRAFRPAYFPIWFLALAMAVNGIGHPALALREGGYFPGLLTAPVVGVLGVWLSVLLWRVTTRGHEARH